MNAFTKRNTAGAGSSLARRTIGIVVGLTLVLAVGVANGAQAHSTLTPGSLCYRAVIQDIGWDPPLTTQPYCSTGPNDYKQVGTTGQSKRMEELAISESGFGRLCVNAYVESEGWQFPKPQCTYDGGKMVTVGTSGRSLRLEALYLWVPSGTICANAHLQNLGWLPSPACGQEITLGTTHQSRRMEAFYAYPG